MILAGAVTVISVNTGVTTPNPPNATPPTHSKQSSMRLWRMFWFYGPKLFIGLTFIRQTQAGPQNNTNVSPLTAACKVAYCTQVCSINLKFLSLYTVKYGVVVLQINLTGKTLLIFVWMKNELHFLGTSILGLKGFYRHENFPPPVSYGTVKPSSSHVD